MDSTQKEPDKSSVIKAGLAGAQAETIQRHGAAIKEHIVAYSGIDHETQTQMTKGLKDIAKSKLNPGYTEQNIRQQSGFSA